jgi:hypothetical protein
MLIFHVICGRNASFSCNVWHSFPFVIRFTSFLASQAFKHLYAKRLAEFGMQAKALHYVEVIAGSVLEQPTSYNASFIKEVYDLGDQLKSYDPLYRVELADPSWLRGLHNVIYNYSVSTI